MTYGPSPGINGPSPDNIGPSPSSNGPCPGEGFQSKFQRIWIYQTSNGLPLLKCLKMGASLQLYEIQVWESNLRIGNSENCKYRGLKSLVKKKDVRLQPDRSGRDFRALWWYWNQTKLMNQNKVGSCQKTIIAKNKWLPPISVFLKGSKTNYMRLFKLTRFPQAHSTDVVLSSLCPPRRWSGAGVGIKMLRTFPYLKIEKLANFHFMVFW